MPIEPPSPEKESDNETNSKQERREGDSSKHVNYTNLLLTHILYNTLSKAGYFRTNSLHFCPEVPT